MRAVRLALAYLGYHWRKSLVLVAMMALILSVPLGLERLLAAAERQLAARAETTPMLLGTRGSRLDLAVGALHFGADPPEPITMGAVDAVWDSGLAAAIPLHLGFRARQAPVVGTSLDYFELRGLRIAEGRGLALLGEAVLGAGIARHLGLAPGDRITTDPESLVDLSAGYPLRMPVVGVLAPTGTPDDEAVFVDLPTAWVIAGIGHGHDDVALGHGPAPDAAQVAYREITEENVAALHFHGDPASYPLTAAIVVPNDTRAGTILKGRYLDPERPVQLVVPSEVIGGLVDQLFRVKRVIDAVVLMVGLAALMAAGLAVYLSLELRRGEFETAALIGASRWTVARLVLAEIACLLAAAALLTALVVATAGVFAGPVARALLAAG